jgi:hypothetical protein
VCLLPLLRQLSNAEVLNRAKKASTPARTWVSKQVVEAKPLKTLTSIRQIILEANKEKSCDQFIKYSDTRETALAEQSSVVG